MILKKLYLTLLFVIVSVSSLYSQEFIQNIEKAIRRGKAKDMSVYFDKYIDLSFSEKTNTYNKKQAEIIIQNFFTKVEPKDLTKINKGYSHANNTVYYIGSLSTSNGQYQIYMFFVVRNATYVLKELRFEKEAKN